MSVLDASFYVCPDCPCQERAVQGLLDENARLRAAARQAVDAIVVCWEEHGGPYDQCSCAGGADVILLGALGEER